MRLLTAVLGLSAFAVFAKDPLYVVQDTPEPMRTLAGVLSKRGYDVRVEDQKSFRPHADSVRASAVFMYIHNVFDADIERALIAYTQRGGRLIVLHHGMASARMKNERWPGFLGVNILARDHADYPWKVYTGTFQVVNLNPGHWVTAHAVNWPKTTRYTPSDSPSIEQELPSFDLPDTELFHNQLFTDARRKTVLLGMKGEVEGRVIMQDRAGWLMPAGKGWVFYFQPGHKGADFENAALTQMIVNAIEWKPGIE